MRKRPRQQPVSYQQLTDMPAHVARKSLEFKLPLAIPLDEDFETYQWKVFFNTPRNKTKIFAE